jgi:hypothetical protein
MFGAEQIQFSAQFFGLVVYPNRYFCLQILANSPKPIEKGP